jgi:hypothetical protein
LRVKIRHVYDFGSARDAVGDDLAAPGAWDALRDVAGAFHLPERRADWEALAQAPGVVERATAVATLAREAGASSLASYGVGTGSLELQISQVDPALQLLCTDNAPRAVARLAELFPEATVVVHDLVAEPPLEADFHLMHRLDTELDDHAWRAVLARFEQPVLFVPSLVLDVVTAAKAVARRVLWRRSTKAGWFRNEAALRSLWAESHWDRPVDVGGARGFRLTRR